MVYSVEDYYSHSQKYKGKKTRWGCAEKKAFLTQEKLPKEMIDLLDINIFVRNKCFVIDSVH